MGRPKDETFWEHVLKEDGGRRCEFCGKRWKGKPSISRLKSHFAGAKNQGIEICEYVPEHVQRAALDAINVSETVKEAALEEIQRKIHERRNKKISSSTTLEDNQMTLVHPNNELANQESDGLMAMGTMIIDEDLLDFGASTLPDVPNENNVRESVQVIDTVGDELITTKLVGIQFEKHCRKIQDWLLDDEVSMIGIHGMPGVGKTELAKHINNDLINASKFHHVCWVTVSPNFSIYKLQDAIAKAVGGIDLSNVDDENIRAARLSKALEKGKRYAIILDDVWDYIPLKGIGIFAGIGTCKLILTTCLLDVCDKMQCEKIIRVEPLNEDDVEDLIRSEIRDELPPSTFEQLIEISNGLPLGIVMMMRNIRGKVEAYEQKIVLDNWEGGTLSLESKEVFSRLRRCYDKLDPTLQQCFLYCALFPNSWIEENELISYLIDEGIINRKKSRRNEFEEGYYMLGRLKNCRLLLGGNRITMHPLFRRMALKINESSMVVVIVARELKKLLEEERSLADIKRISLISDYIGQIPRNYSPSCPNLLTLLLCDRSCLESIPSSFFMKLQGLKFLDLSHNYFLKELPDSISHLVSLRALMLRYCRQLRKVPSLTELKALRKLDLSYSGIEEVPKGLELLSKLEYLGLMDTKLEVLPLEILDKLCCLEVLIIDYNLLRTNAKEIANLRMLETLISRFDNYDEFVAFLEDIKFLQCRYKLYVGRHSNWEQTFIDEEYLSFDKRVEIYDSRLSGEEQVVFPPTKIESLRLFGCQVGRIFSLEKATHLQSLSIYDCESIESFLFLSKSPLIYFQYHPLKVLELSKCPSLKKLFPNWLNLQNLSKLSVRDCDNLEEIVSVMQEETLESTILSGFNDTFDVYCESLCHIQLRDLPKLKSICRGNLDVKSLQNLEVVNCRELERMPLNLVHEHDNPSLLSSLAHAKFYPKEWFDKVQWVHPSTHSLLSSISRFRYLEDDIYSDNDSYFESDACGE